MELRKLTFLEEMLPHFALVKQLTASLTMEEYRQWLMAMIPNNYAMVTALDGEACVGLSGYWIGHKLYCGKYLEIDNFVVAEGSRSIGVGSQLMNWMENEARRQGYSRIMLDAYVENFNAHRFYYRHGFHARGLHYLKHLASGT
ncbi:MAG: GNAT family N-acetyltransferase [Flavobacteriales bacterium]|nr:GNAT family N-acetyltransferase [Flavobacteriales bacterium]